MMIQMSFRTNLSELSIHQLEKYEDELMAFRKDLEVSIEELEAELEQCQAAINERYA